MHVCVPCIAMLHVCLCTRYDCELCLYDCAPCMPSAWGDQEWVSDLLGPELQMAISYQVDSGNQTQNCRGVVSVFQSLEILYFSSTIIFKEGNPLLWSWFRSIECCDSGKMSFYRYVWLPENLWWEWMAQRIQHFRAPLL